MRTLLLLSLCLAPILCRAEIVTIVLAAGQTNVALRINENQSARLTSFVENSGQLVASLYLEATNYVFGISGSSLKANSAGYTPIEVRGPATISLRTQLSTEPEVPHPSAMATFELTPQPFSPDKTITVPAGPGGANVIMESSTDLVNWTAATNGVYTNLTSAKFFQDTGRACPLTRRPLFNLASPDPILYLAACDDQRKKCW